MTYERFTDRARKCMQLAAIEACRLREHKLDSGHVLAGLIVEGSGLGGTVLKDAGVELIAVRQILTNFAEPEPEALAGRLPHTHELDDVLQAAVDAADKLKHHHVGTEHILLGIIRTPDSTGRYALVDCCKDILAVEQAVLRLLEPDALKRLVEIKDPEAAAAITGLLRSELVAELKWHDTRADEIRAALKLDQRDAVLWNGEEGDHTIQVIADGYGGASHVRTDGLPHNEVVLQSDHFDTIAEACRFTESELGLMEGVCNAG